MTPVLSPEQKLKIREFELTHSRRVIALNKLADQQRQLSEELQKIQAEFNSYLESAAKELSIDFETTQFNLETLSFELKPERENV